MNRVIPLLALTTALALAGCSTAAPSAGEATSAPVATATGSTSTTTTPSPSTSSTTTTPAPTAAPVVKDKPALAAALLALEDMPSGFSVEPDTAGSGQSSGGTLTSKSAGCKAFVDLFSSATPPGSSASAHVSFSGGQGGPLVQEELDAVPTSAAVTDLLGRLKASVASCQEATLTIKGVGSSTVTIRQVSPPGVGTGAVALRLSAARGPLQGLEVTQVSTGLGDVMLSMAFLGAYPDEVDDAMGAAADKVTKAFGASTKGSV